MNGRRILQVLAVVSALALAGGFVYVKAGGVIPGLSSPEPVAPRVLPSSKVIIPDAGILTTEAAAAAVPLTPPSERDLLPGSKAPAGIRLWDGKQPLAAPTKPPPPVPAPPVEDGAIMFGPKSAPVITPPAPPTAKPIQPKSKPHAAPILPGESDTRRQGDTPTWHPFQY